MKKYVFVILALLVVGVVHATPTVPVYVDSGELITSYPFEDGSAVVVILQQSGGVDTTIAVIYVHDGTRDTLRTFQLPYDVEVTTLLTQVCGGRLHLTYQANEHVWHATVDLPEAELLYLPVVCGGE